MEEHYLQDKHFNVLLSCEKFENAFFVQNPYECEREKNLYRSLMCKKFLKKDYCKELKKFNRPRSLISDVYIVSKKYSTLQVQREYNLQLRNWKEHPSKRLHVTFRFGSPYAELKDDVDNLLKEWARTRLLSCIFEFNNLRSMEKLHYEVVWDTVQDPQIEFPITSLFQTYDLKSIRNDIHFIVDFHSETQHLRSFAFPVFVTEFKSRKKLPGFSECLFIMPKQSDMDKERIIRNMKKLRNSANCLNGLFKSSLNCYPIECQSNRPLFVLQPDQFHCLKIERSNFFNMFKSTKILIDIIWESGQPNPEIKEVPWKFFLEKSTFSMCMTKAVQRKNCLELECNLLKQSPGSSKDYILLVFAINEDYFSNERKYGKFTVSFFDDEVGNVKDAIDQHECWVTINKFKESTVRSVECHDPSARTKPYTSSLWTYPQLIVKATFFIKFDEINILFPINLFSYRTEELIDNVLRIYNMLYKDKFQEFKEFCIDNIPVYSKDKDDNIIIKLFRVPNKTVFVLSIWRKLRKDFIIKDKNLIREYIVSVDLVSNFKNFPQYYKQISLFGNDCHQSK